MSQTFQVQIIRKAEIKFHTADLVYLFSLKISSFPVNSLQMWKWLFSYTFLNTNIENLIIIFFSNVTNIVHDWTNSLFRYDWTEGLKDRRVSWKKSLGFRIHRVIPQYFKDQFKKLSFYVLNERQIEIALLSGDLSHRARHKHLCQ